MSSTTLLKNRTSQIIKLHEGIATAMRRSVADAVQIGELLTEQKKELSHGDFLPWIEKELPFAQRTAYNYIELFKNRSKIANVANLNEAYQIVRQIESEKDNHQRKVIVQKASQIRDTAEPLFREEVRDQTTEKSQGSFDRIVEAILNSPSPKNEDLALNDARSNIRQKGVFEAIREYVDSFDGVSRQLEATYNLMRYLKRIAIELQPKTQMT